MTLGPITPPLGVAALALSLPVHVELLARLRRAEPASPWWFGYARDGANLSSVLMHWGAYLLCGLAAPEALLAAMLTSLITYLLDWTFARGLGLRRPRLVLAVPLLAWVAAVAFAGRAIGSTLAHLIDANRPL